MFSYVMLLLSSALAKATMGRGSAKVASLKDSSDVDSLSDSDAKPAAAESEEDENEHEDEDSASAASEQGTKKRSAEEAAPAEEE